MARILVIIFVLLANKVVAGYHVAFDKGFAEFAQQHGFNDFNDFLLKRKMPSLFIFDCILPETLFQFLVFAFDI